MTGEHWIVDYKDLGIKVSLSQYRAILDVGDLSRESFVGLSPWQLYFDRKKIHGLAHRVGAKDLRVGENDLTVLIHFGLTFSRVGQRMRRHEIGKFKKVFESVISASAAPLPQNAALGKTYAITRKDPPRYMIDELNTQFPEIFGRR